MEGEVEGREGREGAPDEQCGGGVGEGEREVR